MASGVQDTTDQAPQLIALFVVITALAVFAVALRLTSRRLARLPLWWDDYLVILASILAIIQFALLYETIKLGLGQHVAVVPKENLGPYLAYTYVSEIYYAVVVTCVKSSMLMLYLRLFRVKLGKWCYGLLACVAAWGIAVFFSTVFQCSPVSAAWDKTIVAPNCINLRSWLIGNNVPNILLDVIIILLPMPLIWELRLSLLRKLAVGGIFLLAFATTAISIIRVVANSSIDVNDVTWGFVPTAIYSTVEAAVGIICACLPVMAPVVRMCFGRRVNSSTTPSSQQQRSDTKASATKSGRPSAREQSSFAPLEEDEDYLVYRSAVNEGGAGHSGALPGMPGQNGGDIRLGQIAVRRDIRVESGPR